MRNSRDILLGGVFLFEVTNGPSRPESGSNFKQIHKLDDVDIRLEDNFI